ncbi:MAG: homocysteine S-methyltransferase family protein [Verrucomicrobia bacterium]|nr:homocysteine S-methyltransferase family protein [Verrucomicrobiota bacterium]
MNPKNLLTELSARPLLCDGAMGTQLIAAGLAPGDCGMVWCVEKPEVVEGVHRRYRSAGCDLITSNSFGGCVTNLVSHNLQSRADGLNRAAAQVAGRAAGDSGWVLADIGPFGGFLEPLGEMTADELLKLFVQQSVALKSGGADAALIETMTDPAEVIVAVKAAKQVANWPVIATYAFDRGNGKNYRTMMGTTVEVAMKETIAAGADVVGANCGTAMNLDDYARLAEQMVRAAGKTPVIIQPNAGAPQNVGGKDIYPATPAEMAELVPTLLAAGVRIIGGCCGTSPDHLRAMGEALRKKS